MYLPNIAVANSVSGTNNWAVDLADVQEKHPLKPIGNTVFSILIWDLYKSKLASTSGRYPNTVSSGLVLYEINYLKGISSEDLIMRTIEQWQHIGTFESVYQPFILLLKAMWPDIKKGDYLTLLIAEDSSAFYHNGQLIGEINDFTFGALFLDIWLHENTSQPILRRELLGE